MAEDRTQPGVVPNKLPAMKWEEVKERAQRIADERGFPPYKKDAITVAQISDEEFDIVGRPFELLLDDELAVLSEFMYYWQPYLVLKEKPVGS